MDTFDEGDVDMADESTSGEATDLVARNVVTVADEHTTLRFRG
jgi:hypothetical protein